MRPQACFNACAALVIVSLAAALYATDQQVAGLRGQVVQDRAAYVQQERNDRQALRGLGRGLGGIVRREVAAAVSPRVTPKPRPRPRRAPGVTAPGDSRVPAGQAVPGHRPVTPAGAR